MTVVHSHVRVLALLQVVQWQVVHELFVRVSLLAVLLRQLYLDTLQLLSLDSLSIFEFLPLFLFPLDSLCILDLKFLSLEF